MFNKVLKTADPVELFILSRYLYRVGVPLISDVDYDVLDKNIRVHYNALPKGFQEYLDRTYDDDPIPTVLLQKFELMEYVIKTTPSDYQIMNEDESLSIKPLESERESFDFFEGKRNQTFIFSAKANGVNAKNLYRDSVHTLSLSRGRDSAKCLDFTETIGQILPKHLKSNTANGDLIIYGECLADTDYLPILRKETGRSDCYKTEKSAAISLLRVMHDRHHYKHLKFFAFYAEGLSDTISGTLKVLEDSNFLVVPHIVVKGSEIPKSFSEYKIWIKEKMKWIWDASQEIGLATDGMVVDVDDITYSGDISNQYNNRNAAFKFDYWEGKWYKGVVRKLIFEQQAVQCSTRIEIEPLTMIDGCTTTYVNGFSPDIIFSENLVPGSSIYFRRKSETMNVLIYGDELKTLIRKIS